MRPTTGTRRIDAVIAPATLLAFALTCVIIEITPGPNMARSEEHTSELQLRQYLVCRLLLEIKKMPMLRSWKSKLLIAMLMLVAQWLLPLDSPDQTAMSPITNRDDAKKSRGKRDAKTWQKNR